MKFLLVIILICRLLECHYLYAKDISFDKELKNWQREIKKKPFLIDVEKIPNPFFNKFYNKNFLENNFFVFPFKLVGIIENKKEKLALLQDLDGTGYIAKVGSEIKGFVIIEIGADYILVKKEFLDIVGEKITQIKKIRLREDL